MAKSLNGGIRMHIVYAMQEYPKDNKGCAGSGNYVSNIAHIMTEKGHKVEVVTEGADSGVESCDGIIVHTIDIEKFFHDSGKRMTVSKKIIKNLYRSYIYNKTINKIDRAERVDIVQYGAMYNLAFFRNRKIPAVIRLSEYPVLWRRAGNEEDFNIKSALEEKRLDEELQVYTYNRADKIIAPSYLIKNIVETRVNKEVEVIESPVFLGKSVDFYQQHFSEEKLRGKKYFLYYGGISARKEAHIVAEIIPKILDLYPEHYFVIVGKCLTIPFDSKKRNLLDIIEELPQKYSGRSIYLGSIDNRDRLFSIVSHCDICVLPTRIDNLPNTVIESMGLRKVIVSTDKTSVEQLITDGENGFLCKADDPDSLVQKIQEAMELSDEERILMGKKAEERLSDMQPDIFYEKMMKVYRDTIFGVHQKNKCKRQGA